MWLPRDGQVRNMQSWDFLQWDFCFAAFYAQAGLKLRSSGFPGVSLCGSCWCPGSAEADPDTFWLCMDFSGSTVMRSTCLRLAKYLRIFFCVMSSLLWVVAILTRLRVCLEKWMFLGVWFLVPHKHIEILVS